jgi:hypothetical protein
MPCWLPELRRALCVAHLHGRPVRKAGGSRFFWQRPFAMVRMALLQAAPVGEGTGNHHADRAPANDHYRRVFHLPPRERAAL